MSELLLVAAVILGLNLAFSVLAMLRQQGTVDYMLTAQLLGTNGVGLMLLLAVAFQQPAFIDAALVLALLAAVVAIAFTRRTEESSND